MRIILSIANLVVTVVLLLVGSTSGGSLSGILPQQQSLDVDSDTARQRLVDDAAILIEAGISIYPVLQYLDFMMGPDAPDTTEAYDIFVAATGRRQLQVGTVVLGLEKLAINFAQMMIIRQSYTRMQIIRELRIICGLNFEEAARILKTAYSRNNPPIEIIPIDSQQRVDGLFFAKYLIDRVYNGNYDEEKFFDDPLQTVYNSLRIALFDQDDAMLVFELVVPPGIDTSMHSFESIFEWYLENELDEEQADNMSRQMILIAPRETQNSDYLRMLSLAMYELAANDEVLQLRMDAAGMTNPESSTDNETILRVIRAYQDDIIGFVLK